MHVVFPEDVAGGIIKAWETMPDWVHKKGHLTVIDGMPLLNISVRTCKRPDEDGCHIHIKRLVSARVEDGQLNLKWEREAIPMWRPKHKVHPFWGTRGLQDEFSELYEVDSEKCDQEDDETRLAQYSKWHSIRQDKSEYRPGYLSGMGIQYDEPLPCIRKEGVDTWITCRYHTSINRAKKILALEISADAKAKLLLPLCIRPNRKLDDLPEGDWTWNDFLNWQAKMDERVIYLINKKGYTAEKANKRAFAEFINKYPQIKEYRQNLDNIRLPQEVRAPIVDEVNLIMRRNGFNISRGEAVRAYQHFVKRGTYGFELNPTHICPFTVDVPEGKFPAKIIRGIATNFKMELPKEDNGSWVCCGEVDESGWDWNNRELTEEERKTALGCTCNTCWHTKVYSRDGDKFRLNISPLMHTRLLDNTVDTLVLMDEYGRQAIPAEEYDNMRWAQAHSEAYLELMDELKLKFEVEHRSGPVTIYHKSEEERRKEHLAYIRMRVAENKRANAPWVKWLKEWRKIPYPEKAKRPTLSSDESREKAREILDRERKLSLPSKLSPWEEEEKARLDDYEESRQMFQAMRECRAKLVQQKGAYNVHKEGMPRVKRAHGMWCAYPPSEFDKLFPFWTTN